MMQPYKKHRAGVSKKECIVSKQNKKKEKSQLYPIIFLLDEAPSYNLAHKHLVQVPRVHVKPTHPAPAAGDLAPSWTGSTASNFGGTGAFPRNNPHPRRLFVHCSQPAIRGNLRSHSRHSDRPKKCALRNRVVALAGNRCAETTTRVTAAMQMRRRGVSRP